MSAVPVSAVLVVSLCFIHQGVLFVDSGYPPFFLFLYFLFAWHRVSMDFQGSLDNRSACISGPCLHHIGRTCSERWLKIEDCIEEFGEGKLSMSAMLY